MAEQLDDSSEDQGSLNLEQLFAQLPEYMQGEVMRKDEAEKSAAIIAAVNERREENR